MTDLRYGKKGEDQWTTDLVAALKVRGLDARAFPIYHVREGGRRVQSKPDFVVANGGLSVGSAKLGQHQELKAFSTAQEYQVKLPRAEELRSTPIHETLAVTFAAARFEPFRLHVLASRSRPKEVALSAETLDGLADLIAAVVEGRIASVEASAEPTFKEANRLLVRAAYELAGCIPRIPLERLEPLFGGHYFFQSIFASRKDLGGSRKAETLRLGAAFLFVNQILFYVLLSRAAEEGGRPEKYPAIVDEDMGSPSRLETHYFDKVRDTDYEPIYGIPLGGVFSESKATETTRDIVRAITALAPSIDTRALAGEVFQKLIEAGLRKRLGAHYTNRNAADLLATLSVNDAGDHVMDPACGSGTLLVAGYLRKRALAPDLPAPDAHRRFLTGEITGVDAMAFAAHLAAVNLALQEPLLETEYVRIGTTDSTFLDVSSEVRVTEESLPSMARQSTLKEEFQGPPTTSKRRGPTKLTKNAPRPFTLEPVDVVMMNPPFTSWEHMSEIYRDSLKARFRWIEKAGYPGKFWWRMSQQAFFLLVADRLLRDRGRLGAVLPFTTFTGRAFEPFVHYVLNRYTVKALVVGLGRASFSEDTSLTECLFVAEKTPAPTGHMVAIVGMQKVPEEWRPEEFPRIRDLVEHRDRVADSNVVVKFFPQEQLLPWNSSLSTLALSLHDPFERAVETWENLSRASKIPLLPFSQLSQETGIEATRLASYFGSRPASYYGASALVVLRHADTGSHGTDRLILQTETPDYLVARDRIGGAEYRYPKKSVVAALRRLSFIQSIDISQNADFIAVRASGDVHKALDAIYDPQKASVYLRRLADDRDAGVLRRGIDSGSSRLSLMRRLDLSSDETRVISVRSDNQLLIACDAFLFRGLSSASEDKMLALWFNSTPFLLQFLGHATFTRGTWLKLEDFILNRLIVPDTRCLADPTVAAAVEKAYDDTSHVNLPGLLTQLTEPDPGRLAIDDAVLRLLGVDNTTERLSIGQGLREGVKVALSSLKRTMEASRAAASGQPETTAESTEGAFEESEEGPDAA